MISKKQNKLDYNRQYYLKNKDAIIKRTKDYVKKTNYKYEKTDDQRFIRNIKRKTRYHFPLFNHLCEFCGKKATEHHHNTFPLEFDKFNFICKKCHNIIHKEVENGRKFERSYTKDQKSELPTTSANRGTTEGKSRV
jgi:hypothetical protein